MRFNTKWFTNPFFLYIFSFAFVYAVYSLKWSGAYPNISTSFYIFFTISFVAYYVFGVIFERYKKITFTPIVSFYNPLVIICIIYLGYTIEFINYGGIPLIQIITGVGYHHFDFVGIKTFHTVLSTFTGFYAILIFHRFLSNHSLKLFFYYVILVLPNLLLMNRGGLLVVFAPASFLYLIKLRTINYKLFFVAITIIVGGFWLFGFLGNLRNTESINNKYLIMNGTKVSKSFRDGPIPKEFFWGYLYVATPLGNFQNAVNVTKIEKLKPQPTYFIITQLLPDFISKRIIYYFRIADPVEDKYRVLNNLTASTAFFMPHILMGWSGSIIILLFSITLIICYVFLVPTSSSYFLTGWCIMLTIILLNTFINMWVYSGLSFQLFYCILFSYLEKNRIKII